MTRIINVSDQSGLKASSQGYPWVSLIVALAENRVIGVENRLPWHLPQDLKRFRALTSGHPVIMGRKTFESIGRPLPNRLNIVISRDPNYGAAGVTSATSLEQAIAIAGKARAEDSREDRPEIFVIGGAEIYRLALPLADRLYLTLVHREVQGDAFFPDWREYTWREAGKETHPSMDEATPSFTYLTLDRVKE